MCLSSIMAKKPPALINIQELEIYKFYELQNLEAVRLWLKGKEEWNKWVGENPNANIDFSGVNFGWLKKNFELEDIDFSGFNFPDGLINFDSAVFHSGHLRFVGAQFGKAHVSFVGTFLWSNNISFEGSSFGNGKVVFKDVSFGRVKFHFMDVDVEGRVSFIDCKGDDLSEFSLSGSTFNNLLSIENTNFGCVPDLTKTKITNQFDLQTVNVSLDRDLTSFLLKKARYKSDIQRLRRLKELAQNNQHSKKALEFHADEMRASRWHEMNTEQSILDMVYSAVCSYGQSIFRPFAALVISIELFGFLYAFSAQKIIHNSEQWYSMFLLSAVNTLPLFTFAKETRGQVVASYFQSDTINNSLYTLMGAQALVSVVLIFLIGLGLRNRFRI